MPLNPETGELKDGPLSADDFNALESGINPITGEMGKHYSKKNICTKLAGRSVITPDFHELRLNREMPLFVYGIEMKNGEGSHLLRGARYLGKGHTLTENYTMKMNPQNNPVVFDTKQDATFRNRVRGEVYGVAVEHLHMLDHLNRNGEMFKRTKRKICLEEVGDDYPAEKKFRSFPYEEAFMYLGLDDYWKDYNLKARHTTKYGSKPSIQHQSFFEYIIWDTNDDEWGYGFPTPDTYGGYLHVG